MRNGATTWRDHDRARNVSESRISQASEADLGGPLPMSEFFAAFRFLSFYTWGNSGLGAILRLWESALQDSTRPTSGPCNDGERQWSTMSD